MNSALLSKCALDLGLDEAELQRRIMVAVTRPSPQTLPYLFYVMDEAGDDRHTYPVSMETGVVADGVAALVSRAADDLRKVNASKSAWFDSYLRSQAQRIASDVTHCTALVPAGARCLDVGAAPYLFLLSMMRSERDICAVDINPERHPEAIEQFGLDVRRCNVETDPLPFPDHTFDMVVMHEVFEHMRIDLIHVLAEVRRVLKPDGILTISTPNLRSLRGMTRIIREGVALSCADDLFGEYNKLRSIGHMGHVREYTATEITGFLEEMGFSVTGAVYRHVATQSAPFRPDWGAFMRIMARPDTARTESEATLRAALEQKPDNIYALSRLAAHLGATEGGVLLRDALAASPDLADKLIALAVRLKENGRCQDAVDALEHVRLIAPMNADAPYHRSDCYEAMGRLRPAIEAARESIERAPNGPGRRVQLGRLLIKAGKPNEARVHLAKALELSPGLASARKWLKELGG